MNKNEQFPQGSIAIPVEAIDAGVTEAIEVRVLDSRGNKALGEIAVQDEQ